MRGPTDFDELPKQNVLEDEFYDSDDELHKPHGHDDDENNGCGRGIIKEFKRTVGTWWCKEMTNFNQKTVAVSVFIFFAAIAPAITFGAVYAKSTNNYIGPVEMILATAWCGIVYALIGGQPMMINGGTGPVLAFTTVLFNMADSLGVPFLTLNAWCGLWVTLLMLIAAFVDLNKLMKHATRFTDEIFAMLIAFIFIIDALGNPFNPVGLYWYFEEDHKSHEKYKNDPDYSYMATALLSLILGLGTTGVAFWLRGFKFGRYFFNQAWRSTISDFAVVISIAFFTIVDAVILKSVETESLNVPNEFAPTFQCCDADCTLSWPDDCLNDPQQPAVGRRDWFVDLGDLNGKTWVAVFALVPALLAFILIFLDDGITWHLINHPSNGLTHGEAYNYDTIIIGVMIGVNSLLGLPWLVAATVRSITHVNAMAETDTKGKILSVQETRLTHLFIHLLVLASIFLLQYLKIIPVPVLYGVFLFMGLASLNGNQFFQRFMMYFMQPCKYPEELYIQNCNIRQLRKFTLIQLLLFICLIVFRSVKIIAIAFPIVIKACIPIRMYLLPKWFTEEELIVLDEDDAAIKKLIRRQQKQAMREAHYDENDYDLADSVKEVVKEAESGEQEDSAKDE